MTEQPATIGRYQIRQKLGSGGFATVYRAYDPTLEREVALKVLHPHLASDPTIRERFIREGRALARVKNPNVVTVFEAGELGDLAFLATDLIEGRPLDEILGERGPLPLAEVTRIIEQIGGALAAVHARGLVHRDVKPANIMIETESGRAVLLDLGVARDLANVTSTSGAIIGTPGFMAPEQVDPTIGAVTAQTDVYQLGATAFALLTGASPFSGDTAQMLFAIVHRGPPDLSALRPDLPPGVAGVLAKALLKGPQYRPAGTLAFAESLRAAAGGAPAVAEAPTRERAAPVAVVATETATLPPGAVPLPLPIAPASAPPTSGGRNPGAHARSNADAAEHSHGQLGAAATGARQPRRSDGRAAGDLLWQRRPVQPPGDAHRLAAHAGHQDAPGKRDVAGGLCERHQSHDQAGQYQLHGEAAGRPQPHLPGDVRSR